MFKGISSEIKVYALDSSLHRLNKESKHEGDFGMDNTNELIDSGFGLYSHSEYKKEHWPDQNRILKDRVDPVRQRSVLHWS